MTGGEFDKAPRRGMVQSEAVEKVHGRGYLLLPVRNTVKVAGGGPGQTEISSLPQVLRWWRWLGTPKKDSNFSGGPPRNLKFVTLG